MKRLYFILMLLLASVISMAQEKMKVQLTDGSVIEYDVTEVARVYFETPSIQGEAVDLGLSVLWASWNVGATKAEDIGSYFSWGETETKDNYSISEYIFDYIGDDIAGTSHDAAYVTWGDEWRMPTKSEALELVERCSWSLISQNGVKGFKVTGPSGKSIFLPYTGYISDTNLNYSETCNYWTSTLANGSNSAIAWNLYSQQSGPSVIYWYSPSNNKGRFYGMPIRPVTTKYTKKTGGEGASATNPKDMTSAIYYPSFDNDKYYGWAGTEPTNISYGCFEQWNKTFDNYQTINGLPEGTYEIQVQGFYRKGMAVDDYAYFNSADPSRTDNALIYAITSESQASVPFVSASSAALSNPLGNNVSSVGSGLYIPNDMASASSWFGAGYYNNRLVVKVGSNGLLKIGLKKSKTIDGDWVIVDNWKLIYYGIDEAPASIELDKLPGTWELISYDSKGEERRKLNTTFFEEGVFYSLDVLVSSEAEGTYTVESNRINISAEYGGMPKEFVITTLKQNQMTLKDPQSNEIYQGVRTVVSNPTQTNENRNNIVGNWSVIKNEIDDYPEEREHLSMNVDGTFDHYWVTLKTGQSSYHGKYYIQDNRVYFREATGKDPLSILFVIEKLTDSELILNDGFGKRLYAQLASLQDDEESYLYADSVTVIDYGLIKVKGEATFVNGQCTSMVFSYIYQSKNLANSMWKTFQEDDDIDITEYVYDGDRTISWTMDQEIVSSIATKDKDYVCDFVKTVVQEIIRELQISYESILYKEPYTVWNSSMSKVKNEMSDYSLLQEETLDYGLYQITYNGKYKELFTCYTFDKNRLLVHADIAILTSSTSQEKIENKIQETYSYLFDSDGAKVYASSDQETIVFLTEDTSTGAYYVDYYSYDYLMSLGDDDVRYFEEPYIKWGASRPTVKTEMAKRGYTLYKESTNVSEGYHLAYNGKYEEGLSMYLFDRLMQLEQVQVAFAGNLIDELRNYVVSSMSYTFAGTSNDGSQYFYLTPDMSSFAIIYISSADAQPMTMITYFSYDSIMSVPSRVKSRDGGKKTFVSGTLIDVPSALLDNVIDINHKKLIERFNRTVHHVKIEDSVRHTPYRLQTIIQRIIR